MQIDFYTNFYKKKNSTKRPTETGITAKYTVSGYLKEPSSVLNPVINIQNVPVQNAPEVLSYAYIPVFGRYYFVDDWVWNDGLWEVHMDVDALATYRHVIGEQSEYILRTDSTSNPLNYDGAISDGMYPATTNFSITRLTLTNPFQESVANGVYILGVINKEDQNAMGAITYYAMTPAEFGTFKQVMMSPSALESMNLIQIISGGYEWIATDMSEQIFKTMYNPYQYVASCLWFPISPSQIPGTAVTKIALGWWEFNTPGKRISSFVGIFNDSIEQIPPHPLATYRGKYLDYAPYTKLSLHGKFGTIPLDPSYFEVGSYIVNTYTVDYVTGQCLFEVFTSDNAGGTNRKLITKTEFLIGVPIQIAQIGRDYLGTASNAIQAGSSAMSGAMMGSVAGVGGAIIGALASGAGAIINTINSAMPQMQTTGINGSLIENGLSSVLIIYHYGIVDEDITHRGRPLYQSRRIDTLSGYVLCAEGDIDLDAFDSERQEVARFLTTGFFWE